MRGASTEGARRVVGVLGLVPRELARCGGLVTLALLRLGLARRVRAVWAARRRVRGRVSIIRGKAEVFQAIAEVNELLGPRLLPRSDLLL